jgi:hypothetical protein
MMKSSLTAAAAAMALSFPAWAQDAEIARIREELQQMRDGYERRIEALERRLMEAENRAAATSPPATSGSGSGARSAGGGEVSFNPAVSLILQGTYAHTTKDPNRFESTGFMPSGGEVGPPKRSFGLAETELVFSANVDPYFRGVAIAALTPENEVEVEEAYFQTLALPQGFTLKGGRFLSGIGYQNELHQHAWDFQDAPLPYKAFLGGRLRQEGIQLKWIAPTDLFVELGAEAARGDQFPGADRNKNGVGASAIFGHVGGDLGPSYSWRAGLSYVDAKPRERSYEDLDSLDRAVGNSFSGRASVWVADAVLKWAPDGNSVRTNFKLQGEYFRFRQSGSLTYDDTAGSAAFGSVTDRFRSRQSGWYVQGVWQFMPRWRVGYRYDELRHGTVNNALAANGVGGLTPADFPLLAAYNPTRNTIMTDWSPTEFSRIRLQLAADKSRMGTTDRQIMLQYIDSIGPHGAHQC